MRVVCVAALAAGLFAIPAVSPATAADQVLTPKKCGMSISNRVASGSRRCTALILRQDIPNARAEFVLEFPDGFKLEVAGPSLSLNPSAFMVTADRIVWANPGQTTPSVEVNTPEKPLVKGRCVVRNHRGPEGVIGSVLCSLGSATLGRIEVEFVTPKPDRD